MSPAAITAELPPRGSNPGRTWLQPMLWIVLIPIVTVPSTLALTGLITGTSACNTEVNFLGGDASCQVGPVLTALAPGLLNLVPVLWLLSRNSKTRLAGIIATILGALRLAFPAVALVATAGSQSIAGSGVVQCNGPCTYLAWGLNPAFPNSGIYQITNIGGPVSIQIPNVQASGFVLAISVFLWLVTLGTMISMRRLPNTNSLEPGTQSQP